MSADLNKYAALWVGLLYGDVKIIAVGTIPTDFFRMKSIEVQYNTMYVSATYINDTSIAVTATDGQKAVIYGVK